MMLKPAYIIQKFSEDLSKITTIKQLVQLMQDQKFDLEIDFVHMIPRVLTWNPATDSFSEEYNLLIDPRIIIEEKTFSLSETIISAMPLGMVDSERVFLETLKKAIRIIDKI